MQTISDAYTISGHLIGMLDRDQRTTKSRTYIKPSCDTPPSATTTTTTASPNNNQEPSESANSARTASRTVKCPISYIRRSLLRFKQVLVVSTYLLLFLPNNASAAPAAKMGSKYTDNHPEWNAPEKWILSHNTNQSNIDMTDMARSNIVRMVKKQATTAFHKASSKLENYTHDQFGMASNVVNQLYQDQRFDWLPSSDDIPKKFGEDITDDLSIEMTDALKLLYPQFQKVAVGLEQIVWDRKDQSLDESAFLDMTDDLRAVIGELFIGIKMMNESLPEDIRRTHMPESIRDVNETDRRVRDWIIYRDYINLLEYTMQLFARFQKDSEQSQ